MGRRARWPAGDARAPDPAWADRRSAIVAALLARRARILRFGLTGGAAALLQLALLIAFERLAWPTLLANGVAFALAAQFNFAASQTFTWGDRPDTGRLAARWLRYHGAIAGSALLNMAVFAVASRGLPSLVAAGLGIAAAASVNFVSGDRLVFRSVTRPPARPSVAVPVPIDLAASARSTSVSRSGPLRRGLL